ncbi:HdeD family acid-resistance protein [Ligilactobacillus faecis]|uniref:HdeD family acid-resistance protein n=1 Tax=Ligilactobacillus faecis TaxID=762833 RepID=UPI00246958DD|nr:DUF308 domain-containing protein [Ligilactobacillus faecis]WGN90347.1 DUF308 domain-containing protein [Ligilactobacillus faecis]
MQTAKRGFDWFSLVVGIILVIAGIASFMRPDATLKFVSICLGIGLLVKGIYELWFRQGINNWFGEKSGWLLFMGIIDIILGLLFIFRAASGVVVIAYIFAFWFIFDSIAEIATANYFKRLNRGYYVAMLILNILALLVGFILLFNPLIAASTLVLIISFYLLLIGFIKIIQAF